MKKNSDMSSTTCLVNGDVSTAKQTTLLPKNQASMIGRPTAWGPLGWLKEMAVI